MDQWLHILRSLVWNYLSIPKLQRCSRWSLGMYKLFHPSLNWACDYLSVNNFLYFRVHMFSCIDIIVFIYLVIIIFICVYAVLYIRAPIFIFISADRFIVLRSYHFLPKVAPCDKSVYYSYSSVPMFSHMLSVPLFPNPVFFRIYIPCSIGFPHFPSPFVSLFPCSLST